MYRGALLIAVAYLARRIASRRWRHALVIAAVLAVAALFGAGHADYSMLNAVTAGVGGVILGAVAVWTRSIWPGVIAHTLLNLWVGINLAVRLAGA